MFIFLAEGQWFSPGTSVSSTNKTDCQDITEILLKVPLNSITLIMFIFQMDIVLEMAHKVDDTGNNNIPSRELVQEKIIFNCGDILMVTAVDVDLDFAVKGKPILVYKVHWIKVCGLDQCCTFSILRCTD
jgi:hypothetical protein